MSCKECPEETYSTSETAVSCLPCPANLHSANGSIACIPCSAGSMMVLGNRCVKCSIGMYSTIGSF
jgi:Tyrosine-protein kinase ephrin type A/B receptor-like